MLVGVAELGEHRRDSTGGEDRQREPHVAVRQRLGDEGVGDGGALLGDAVVVLGDLDRGDAELGGLGGQARGIAGGVVGLPGGRAQDLLGELGDRLDDHLLVVVGGEVEVVRTRRRRQPGGRAAESLDLGELPGGGAHRGEAVLHAELQHAVEPVAQAATVQQVAADQRGEQAHATVEEVAPGFVGADGAVAGHAHNLTPQ